VQDKSRLNLYASVGVAVREMDTGTGPADYMLFVDGNACGIIEAKREGTDLGGVAEQSARYAISHTRHIERWVPEDQPLPFLYEATNHEVRFRDERDRRQLAH
jgi:type I restriction enzyme R subunit